MCSDTDTKHDKFKSHRKNLKTIIDTAKKKYNTGKILECNGDSKKVWQIINNVRGKQNKELKPHFVINNELIINRRIIANELNKYFISLAPTLMKHIIATLASVFRGYWILKIICQNHVMLVFS